jgi:hypothetical protein
MKNGIELIAEERKEQIEKHGWTLEHDRGHIDGAILRAAIYAIEASQHNSDTFNWYDFQKKILAKPYIERLVIAGALIAAEIDRLQSPQKGEAE